MILSFINSWSSSNLEIRCCKSPCEESPVDRTSGGKVGEGDDEDEADDDGTDAEYGRDVVGGAP
jgi:hypothetical protein